MTVLGTLPEALPCPTPEQTFKLHEEHKYQQLTLSGTLPEALPGQAGRRGHLS